MGLSFGLGIRSGARAAGVANLLANSVWQEGPTATLPAAWGAAGGTGTRTISQSTIDPLDNAIQFVASTQRPFVDFVGPAVASGDVVTLSFDVEAIVDITGLTWARLMTISGVTFTPDYNGVTANGGLVITGVTAGNRIYLRATYTAAGTPTYRVGLGGAATATGNITLSRPTLVRGTGTQYIRTGITDQGPFDILPIFGQSNTFNGLTLDSGLDVSDAAVFQIRQNGAVAMAAEPLAHPVVTANAIGHALAFARLYRADNPGRKVLIVPYGINGSGFSDNEWNNGNPSFEAAVKLANLAYSTHPDNRWLALLWQCGETDAEVPQTEIAHAAALDAMIAALRTDLTAASGLLVIAGQMAPTWVAANPARQPVQNAITNLPGRVANTALAVSTALTVHDTIHFDAASQRVLAQRKYAALGL